MFVLRLTGSGTKWQSECLQSLGASGAVNAVVIMSAALSPYRTFLIYGVLPIAAWQAASLWIAYDVYGAAQVTFAWPLFDLR